MLIIRHFGLSINSSGQLISNWRLDRCPRCKSDKLREHDDLPHTGLPGEGPMWVPRFRCRSCGEVIHVLPDALLPRCRYPAEVRDRAILLYLEGHWTYQQVADEVGVATSTVWRWMHALTEKAQSWLEKTRAWLHKLGQPDGPVVFRDDLRTMFLVRRVRRPGMLEGLLTSEALVSWLERLRKALQERDWGPLAGGVWGFGIHVLEALTA